MKVLVIGGNRFVGLRLTHALSQMSEIDLNIVNRTGQAPHATGAAVYKVDRDNWEGSHVDRDWDVIVDFACFTDVQARGSLEYFKNVGRYVFISTISIYDEAAALKESAFDARAFDLSAPVIGGYRDGKRRAEAVFVQEARFPVLHVRSPLILGPDDYTRRLEMHVQRIERGQPLYVPNLDARISMIHAEDAARFLQETLTATYDGPLNVAAPQPIAVRDFLHRIERQVGRKTLLVDKGTEENTARYGWPQDCFADVTRATQLGFKARPIDEWIEDLIAGARLTPAKTQLH